MYFIGQKNAISLISIEKFEHIFFSLSLQDPSIHQLLSPLILYTFIGRCDKHIIPKINFSLGEKWWVVDKWGMSGVKQSGYDDCALSSFVIKTRMIAIHCSQFYFTVFAAAAVSRIFNLKMTSIIRIIMENCVIPFIFHLILFILSLYVLLSGFTFSTTFGKKTIRYSKNMSHSHIFVQKKMIFSLFFQHMAWWWIINRFWNLQLYKEEK